jgi:F-type H+-transporting ATPase subunit epsilon
MDAIHLHIVTAEATVFDRRVNYVNLPQSYGSLGILRGHAPLLCALEGGVIRCTGEEGAARIRVGKGVADVADNEITVLVSAAEILEDAAE